MMKLGVLIAAVLAMSAAARAQTANTLTGKYYHLYEGKLIQRSIPTPLVIMTLEEDQELSHFVSIKEGEQVCNGQLQKDLSLRLCSGKVIRFVSAKSLVSGGTLIATLLDSRGEPSGEGSAVLERQYYQQGEHNSTLDE